MTERFLRIRQIVERTGIPKSTIYQMVKEGRFPRQRRVSHKVAVWTETSVSEWIEKNMLPNA